jgi:SPP1 family predicted phage head-tail adaptor
MAEGAAVRRAHGDGARDGGPEIARLRQRMAIETPVETPDGAGGAERSWQPLVTVWAGLEWLGGEERWREGGPEQAGRWRVTMRWRAGVDAGMRLRLAGRGAAERLFDIRAAADPDGAGRRLICLCEEITP